MWPTLFQLGSFSLPTFGVIVAFAFWAGLQWMVQRAKAAGEPESLYVEAATWIILSAIVGARLMYLVFFPDLFWANPLGALFSTGGLVWYGGMAGVILSIWLFCRRHQLRFWRFTDILAPPTALGLAIGRLGCLAAGCCFGSACDLPWAIHYPLSHPTHGMGVHPAPLYETVSLLAVLGVMRGLPHRFEGQQAAVFFILYGVIRFAIEALRGDRLLVLDPLSASQLISLLGIVVGLGLWAWRSKVSPLPAAGA
jgi:phosphatidylglycerol:prolipoprotein diacylglycerol transferase